MLNYILWPLVIIVIVFLIREIYKMLEGLGLALCEYDEYRSVRDE